MSSHIQIAKSCLFCGKKFTAKTLHTKYCSHTCNRKHYKLLKREERLKDFFSQEKATTPSPSIDAVILQQKVFLSVRETALLLGASLRTIQRLIAQGSLKVGKLGSRSIVMRAEIDKLFH